MPERRTPEMKIAISNLQNPCRLDLRKLASLTTFFMVNASRREPRQPWGTIRLVLTDNIGIRDLHAQWMGTLLITDVLSQCYAPIPGEPPRMEGEIVVNVQRATESGPRHWRRSGLGPRAGMTSELALYVAHGCDHLTGADDASAQQRQQMRRRELRWLRGARQAGLLHQLIRS